MKLRPALWSTLFHLLSKPDNYITRNPTCVTALSEEAKAIVMDLESQWRLLPVQVERFLMEMQVACQTCNFGSCWEAIITYRSTIVDQWTVGNSLGLDWRDELGPLFWLALTHSVQTCNASWSLAYAKKCGERRDTKETKWRRGGEGNRRKGKEEDDFVYFPVWERGMVGVSMSLWYHL